MENIKDLHIQYFKQNPVGNLYEKLGNHWVEISKHLEGRSGNSVKNRWHKHLKKSVSKNYLDSLSQAPYSHETLLDLNLPDLQPLKDANEDQDKKDDSLETLDQIL